MSAQVKGVQELIEKLKKNEDLTPIKQVVKKHGSQMQTKAMRAAPVAPVNGGTLRRSIGMNVFSSGMAVSVEPKAHYASYVEYGTRYMTAQPFMRPAFYEQAPKFINDLKKLMK